MTEKKALPESRLATTDEVGRRVYLHPLEVKGKWKDIRRIVYWFLIFLYLFLPWVYINGKQIILLDLPAREFYIFGTTFYGHDGPILIYLLLGFVFLVSGITALWGRVWCGYACPQTVFIDSLFRPIERFVEGGARKREKLHYGPWTFEKLWKRGAKWFLFLLVSLHIVHSGLGYFVGTRNLINISLHSPAEHPTLFITMLVLTGIILLDFGWFREQFCIIACPYGRFQSLVMDENSLIVSYDEKRGEPRKRTKGVATKDEGDCVNCGLCVKACPTGIDIRDGLQMECIACTMCIDACDDIMERVKKPKGLIKYTTELKQEGKPGRISPRVYIYFVLFLAAMIGLVSHLTLRQSLKSQLIRGSKSPYQVIQKANEKKIVNHYKLKLSYYQTERTTLKIVRNTEKNKYPVEITLPEEVIEFDEDNIEANVFFQFDQSILDNGLQKIYIDLVEIETNKVLKTLEVKLVGPLK